MSLAAGAYCARHPGVDATATCDDCKTPICTRCTKGTLDGFMCPPCAHKRYARRRLVTGLKVGGVVVGLAGLVVFGLFVVGKGSEHGPPPPIDAGQDLVVEMMRADRDRTPCEKAVVRKLVVRLNEEHRYAEAVDDARAYFARCDDFPRLRWDLVHALQELGRHPEAIEQETLLITRDPYDSDFWWWRGEDRAKARQPAQALADYRQSLANSEDASGSRFAAARVLDVVEDAGRPCEGVAALEFFVSVHGGSLGRQLEAELAELDRKAGCAAGAGVGGTELPSLAAGPARVKVQVGAVVGTFQVDERCGTTALTRAFAERAAVAPTATALDTIALGAIRPGVAATAAITTGKASAPGVEVAIVPELPDGLDGVLGLSYLWLFELERRDDGGLTLTGR